VVGSIVFHSYKGGTGKTTLAVNVSALLARAGYRVVLLDLDVYAPTLHSYFGIEPPKWINDFLFEVAEAKDILTDVTPILSKSAAEGNASHENNSGKLFVGFSNPSKDEIYKLEGGTREKVQLLRRFISLREEIFSAINADYLIIDTSPGIRYWSLNALAVANVLYLALKAGDVDIAGTKKMAADIYSAFSKFGAKPFLILNRVAGYCVPNTLLQRQPTPDHSDPSTSSSSTLSLIPGQNEMSQVSKERSAEIIKNIGINIVAEMPCFCDIMFSEKEFLTVLHDPDHPFSKRIGDLATQSQRLLGEKSSNG